MGRHRNPEPDREPASSGDTEMTEDYAQALLDIKALRAQAYEAMQTHQWAKACDLADEIVAAAQKIRVYCLNIQLDEIGELYKVKVE